MRFFGARGLVELGQVASGSETEKLFAGRQKREISGSQ